MLDLTAVYTSGAFGGICAVVVLLSLLIGYAYDEHMLWWHAGALGVALLAQYFSTHQAPLAMALALVLWAVHLALAAQTLIATVGTEGAMRRPARTLRLLSLLLACLLGSQLFAGLTLAWFVFPWSMATVWCLYRSWNQSKPWIYWLTLGQAALLSYWLLVTSGAQNKAVSSMAALSVFAIASYLAMVWKSRMSAENSLRIEAREKTDPLTGLLMPRLFSDRIEGALVRSHNLGYLSALMLIRVVNIDKIIAEQGMENSEAVILGASHAIAKTLRAQDAAARLSGNRFGVLAEGIARGASSQLATRILAHGLRGEDWGLRGSKLEFHIALIEIGPVEMTVNHVLLDLETALDEIGIRNAGPRIRTVHATPMKQAA